MVRRLTYSAWVACCSASAIRRFESCLSRWEGCLEEETNPTGDSTGTNGPRHPVELLAGILKENMSDKKDELKADQFCGCVTAFWTLFITIPLGLALWFGVLTAVEPASWVWNVFWVYGASLFINGIFSAILKVLLTAKV